MGDREHIFQPQGSELDGSRPAGGILILPTREFYQYLTDRVGNFREFAPYFPMRKALNVDEGFLAIIAVEHDYGSTDVPRIEKGTNGRALM